MKVIIHNVGENADVWRALGVAYRDFIKSDHKDCAYACTGEDGTVTRIYAERNRASIRLVVQPEEES